MFIAHAMKYPATDIFRNTNWSCIQVVTWNQYNLVGKAIQLIHLRDPWWWWAKYGFVLVLAKTRHLVDKVDLLQTKNDLRQDLGGNVYFSCQIRVIKWKISCCFLTKSNRFVLIVLIAMTCDQTWQWKWTELLSWWLIQILCILRLSNAFWRKKKDVRINLETESDLWVIEAPLLLLLFNLTCFVFFFSK